MWEKLHAAFWLDLIKLCTAARENPNVPAPKLGEKYVGGVPAGSDGEDFIEKRWNLDVRAPFHSDLALLSSVHLGERTHLRQDGGNLGNKETIARSMFLPQILESFKHHRLASLDTFVLLEGAAIWKKITLGYGRKQASIQSVSHPSNK